MASDIEEKVEKFLSLAKEDSHHSNKSWEYCYLFFCSFSHDVEKANGQISDEDMSLACLHLGFYLASWGMYRGSTFVRRKDYKIYKDVIRTLTKSEFDGLWNPNYYDDLLKREGEITKDDKEIENLFRLKNEIKKSLERHSWINSLKKQKEHFNVTDTLITKILLGTMACVPAYDNYFKIGLRKRSVTPFSSFSKKSFVEVLNFCKNNELRKIKKCIPNSEYYYPLMKIVDMYFWTLGAESNKKM